ncbi:TPA: ATP-binding protein [Vibrio diabolicus]|uniref:ATP-binding protein n=1 Tax=Vibrio TaxID=662 RepID=UPI0007210C4F|nr:MULTISPECIES: ATP-binding protein [Vibrio]ALR91162.1 DNA biosynthesis protein [Vibrio alginolyticus]AVF59853.1 DNA biosynthesis protein [Vibrio diabolicus]EGQ7646295.1 ATP-binding protein [Vibrio alginolyticus]EGQ8115105.1 DNA biosynthesis protein [Vibrio parahaemolyticus]EJI1395483.1 ATP-binding protein [Vibrio parahaemolyticus]
MNSFFQKLQQAMPANVVPYTPEQMAQLAQQEVEKQSHAVYQNYQQSKVQDLLGRSGVGKKHLKCRFANYVTENQGQRQAFSVSRRWVSEFLEGDEKNFVFSGSTGTGKNHLACAMANSLMTRNRTVLVITVAELMMKIRDKYNRQSNVTEAQFLKYLAQVDLLVLDEVGVQRMNDHEAIMINTIIDSRYTNEKPTGILTNLKSDDLTQVLGARVMERLLESCEWVSFTWESFRKQVRNSKEVA